MPYLRRSLVELALFSPAAGAAPSVAPAPSASIYAVLRDLDLTALLPPPAARGSDREANELRDVRAIQASAVATRIAVARAEAAMDFARLCRALLGAPTEPVSDAFPLARAFLMRIDTSLSEVVRAAAERFARTPPWLADAGVRALVPQVRTGSYPCLPAARARVAAALLRQVVGAPVPELWSRAAAFGEGRVVGGMAFPSDVQAGVEAGTAIAAMLLGSPSWRGDYDAVRPELRRGLGL